jgi:hypothetical protein
MAKPKAFFTMQAIIISTGEIFEWQACDAPDYVCRQQKKYHPSDLSAPHVKGSSPTRRAALEED